MPKPKLALRVYLRVNQVPISKAHFRPKPWGGYDFVIVDPVLGEFAIDDKFELEILGRHGSWMPITLTHLKSLQMSRLR